ncbi:hypothetical protein [Pantoea agglomerans]|uniref:hypothetical protein n=1 Tax=Enterobacter agglomerans TaxID=549 RepID=UPI0032086A3E
MPQSKPLSRAERAWLTELQRLLNARPTDRLGFYTIGDNSVTVFDLTKEDAINARLDELNGRGDFCGASRELGADLGHLFFPAPVLSTAG